MGVIARSSAGVGDVATLRAGRVAGLFALDRARDADAGDGNPARRGSSSFMLLFIITHYTRTGSGVQAALCALCTPAPCIQTP